MLLLLSRKQKINFRYYASTKELVKYIDNERTGQKSGSDWFAKMYRGYWESSPVGSVLECANKIWKQSKQCSQVTSSTFMLVVLFTWQPKFHINNKKQWANTSSFDLQQVKNHLQIFFNNASLIGSLPSSCKIKN